MSKFTITNKELKNPLSLCMIVAPTTRPMQILQNIWFQDGKLTAGDGQSQISVECAVDGNFTVPADRLKKLCSAFSDDAELSFDVKGDKLTVKSGKSRLTLPITAPDMFPVPKIEGAHKAFKLKQEDIKYHIKNVVYAAAQNNVKQWMNAILFRNTNTLLIAGTTGLELATSNQAINAEPFDFSIPSSVAVRLEKLMSDGDVDILVYENKIVFKFDDVEFIAPLCIDKYPDVTKAIPKLNSAITFTKSDFLEMSSRASINASRFSGAEVSIASNEMTIECKDFGSDSSDSMTVDYSGADVKFGYNILQMRNAVSSIQSEQVEMHIAQNGTAMFISDGGMQRNVISCMRI